MAQGGLPRAGLTGVWPTALRSSGVREAQAVESAVLISQTELLGTFSSEGGGELEGSAWGWWCFCMPSDQTSLLLPLTSPG